MVEVLDAVDALIQEINLVLSAVVLVFWLSYSLMLYHQHKRGVVRKDWWMSMVFYVGIGLLVLGNLLLAFSQLYHTEFGARASITLNMISMLVFILAFYLRMKTSLEGMQQSALTKAKARKR